MDLDEALRRFDLVEANLAKLEQVWARIEGMIPSGITLVGAGPSGRAYREALRSYAELLKGLPKIDGWSIGAAPLELNEIAQNRQDAQELGFFDAINSTEQDISRPGVEIEEYRSRFNTKRRELVRSRQGELVDRVEIALNELKAEGVSRDAPASMRSPVWERLEGHVSEVDRLLGGAPRSKAWGDLRRHLSYAMACDLHDIYEHDWPAVKREIAMSSYDDSEPLHVGVEDLGQLVAAKPAGSVTTALNWGAINADGFERLLFELIGDADGYQNPELLMQTNAPDRARDLSVWRVREDVLSGVSRDRVIIQCKHWLSKSVGDTDVADALTKVSHWEPPRVDVLVVATSGRFTADGVKWVEQHNHAGKLPRVEMWPESHLERLLAQRPHIVATFKLHTAASQREA